MQKWSGNDVAVLSAIDVPSGLHSFPLELFSAAT